jgi:hypothetical protein
MSSSYNVQPSERTEIVRGSENVIDAGLKFISTAKAMIDACVDFTRPALAVDIESISKSLADIKAKRGDTTKSTRRNYGRKYIFM